MVFGTVAVRKIRHRCPEMVWKRLKDFDLKVSANLANGAKSDGFQNKRRKVKDFENECRKVEGRS